MEYLDTVIANPNKLKDKTKKIEKFLKKKSKNKNTGEEIEVDTQLSIDMDKVQECRDLFGYYTLMTSEIEKAESSSMQ